MASTLNRSSARPTCRYTPSSSTSMSPMRTHSPCSRSRVRSARRQYPDVLLSHRIHRRPGVPGVTGAPSSSRSDTSAPGTGRPRRPGRCSPSRVDSTMLDASEHPNPSSTSRSGSTSASRSSTGPGRESPDDTPSRRPSSVGRSPGCRARKAASCDQNVGTPESTVTPCAAHARVTVRTVGRVGRCTTCAPRPRGRKNPLPNPREVKPRDTAWQVSPGARPSTWSA